MEIQCPACRKKSDRIDNCPRCDLDLIPLKNILALSEHHISKSLLSLSTEAYSEAYKNAIFAWSLKNSSKSARLAFFSALLEDDFEKARIWYKKC